MSFTGLMNCKSPFTSKKGKSDDELGISLAYVVEVPDEDRKFIRTILLTSGKIVSLSLLPLKNKEKKYGTRSCSWKTHSNVSGGEASRRKTAILH